MLKLVVLIVAIAAILLLAPVDPARAQLTPGHVLTGTATLDGSPAPKGTVVTAWNDFIQVGSATVSDGKYVLFAKQAQGASKDSKTLTLQIGDALANETAIWKRDGTDELNLTGSSERLRCPSCRLRYGRCLGL